VRSIIYYKLDYVHYCMKIATQVNSRYKLDNLSKECGVLGKNVPRQVEDHPTREPPHDCCGRRVAPIREEGRRIGLERLLHDAARKGRRGHANVLRGVQAVGHKIRVRGIRRAREDVDEVRRKVVGDLGSHEASAKEHDVDVERPELHV
jgi:hypothetical protein